MDKAIPKSAVAADAPQCTCPARPPFLLHHNPYKQWYARPPAWPRRAPDPTQSSRIEILNDGGFRSDGRRPAELRATAFDLAAHAGADGAAAVSHGLTHVRAAVFGPREARVRAQTLHDRALVVVDVAFAPFSAGERRRRPRGDKRALELAATLKSVLDATIHTALFPRAQIDVHVHVLQQDGGVLPACANAAALALAAAGVPMRGLPAALSAGAHPGAGRAAGGALLDLSALEEADVPSLVVALAPGPATAAATASGQEQEGGPRLALVSMETRLHVDRFAEVLRAACEGAVVLRGEMRAAVLEKTRVLVGAMDAGAGGARLGGGGGGEEEAGMGMEE
ncbi:hypothetical protein HETIRDRAFT_315522 [Heterobasidion irregulare TC 32-1]|uniref:Ribosomal RNA-processing protein 41 n=1 Tax=Heterobasidion irregulare (strain TC 32-1) TaxID=747525 RepID=W4KAW0_HETIT|nr:uncharacterized protein HETIRDRAFT_315522 [Heterobasidion irregulare TC 32-1]ETW82923.1 hypothetical protein HETIRDRAFT_315522 [Heterobasidion irregulare TC 32-1]